MQIVKFPDDFYDDGVVKFAAGQFYPLNSETQSLVNAGYAELLDPERMQEDVEALKALAKLARDRADSCAAWAQSLAKEADEAEQLAAVAEAAKKKSAPIGDTKAATDPDVQTSALKNPATARGKKKAAETPPAEGAGQPPAETGAGESTTQTTETQ